MVGTVLLLLLSDPLGTCAAVFWVLGFDFGYALQYLVYHLVNQVVMFNPYRLVLY